MAWYRTGTVAVTNGQTAVTGTGTLWVANVLPGQGIALPDGRIYEVAGVVSNTQITLAVGYLGATASAQPYVIVPTRGPELQLVQEITQMVSQYGAAFLGAGQGRFGDGTLTQPGLRFAADENTGFHRPAADQIGAVTNGVLRWLLSNTAFQVNVPITGTAVTQGATDTTAGRLLKVGDFGLGATIPGVPGNDCDLIDAASGIYVFAVATLNRPPVGNGTIIHSRHTTGIFTQIAVTRTTGAADRIYTRSNSGSGWTPWNLNYGQNTILGTVSQSGGVPTGAIIERGANANGEFVRFADGTQICTFVASGILTVQEATGNIFRSATEFTWTFPAAFIDANVAVIAPVRDAGVWSNGRVSSATTGAVRLYSSVSVSVARSADLRAIGRWF